VQPPYPVRMARLPRRKRVPEIVFGRLWSNTSIRDGDDVEISQVMDCFRGGKYVGKEKDEFTVP